jgi:D-alanyl-lipoteichoic acid acyltransferase DltB (MBOAT superfamily)
MLFNSFEFLVFFLIVWPLYWVVPFRTQNLLLLAASYLFYSFWDWRFLSLILTSTIVDYYAGLKIEKANRNTFAVDVKRKKAWLIISLCINLAILWFFKYFNFFIESVIALLVRTGLNVEHLRLDIVLPVGISFYTFKTISYTIDIYRGEMHATRNFLDFALYLSYFPQLLAGPIDRAKNLLPAISLKRTFDRGQITDGLQLVLVGLFKKVYVADNLAPYVEHIFNNPDPSGVQVMAGMYGFAIQIYCDFSGYSDIACGCSKCLGIELVLNFKYPYIAVDPSDFWKRWHISLSSWLRDYLYIPLGGNRYGKGKTYRNLGLTMLLGGLWHGAAWNFVIWGAWHGSLLIGYRLAQELPDCSNVFRRTVPGWLRRGGKILLIFQLVCLGWIVFRCSSMNQILLMFSNLFLWNESTGAAPEELFMSLLKFGLPLFVFEYVHHRAEKFDWRRVPLSREITQCAMYSAIFYMVAFYGASAQSFIYFQF